MFGRLLELGAHSVEKAERGQTTAEADLLYLINALRPFLLLDCPPCGITGRTRRFVSMPSTACSASRCCNTYAGRQRRHGPDSPPKNFWTSCVRSRNTLCYIRPKAARGQTESPRFCPNNHLRNKDSRRNLVSISSVVPNVGNTTATE